MLSEPREGSASVGTSPRTASPEPAHPTFLSETWEVMYGEDGRPNGRKRRRLSPEHNGSESR